MNFPAKTPRRRHFDATPWLLALPVLAALIILVVIPSLRLLLHSFQPSADDETGYTLLNYAEFFSSRAALQAGLRTLRVSLITTILSIVAAYPVAYYLAKSRSRLRPVLLSIVVFPLLISVIVRAYGWTVVLGRNGLVNVVLRDWLGIIEEPLRMINNEFGIVVGVTHLLLPYMILSLTAVIQKIDPALEEAAQSLGATPIGVFFRVILPLSAPGLLSGTLLVFSLSVTAFATPLLLGGARTPVLTTLLYQYVFFSYDWIKAATVGVVLLCVGVVFVFMHRRFATHTLRGLE